MLVNTKDIKTAGSLGGRKIAMSLDTNSLVHLMSVLSDLYSDPAGAVIREYTTNALDSHLASGQTRPVEISTPSRMSPYFVVQDFGVGMSEDDIENIYSQFGNSTKRGNNLEAGMLGLGSKSALTYTEQFNLITVKDGIQLLVSISRSADGSGGIEIVNAHSTTAPNGVTIKVPVQSNIAEFNQKVHEFAKYVTKGMILVNGSEPESNLDFVTPDIAMVPRKDRYEKDRVVMGNVSYPVLGSPILDTHKIIYFAPMGSIDFTPSREELMDTSITRQTLSDMRAHFQKYFEGHLDKRIQKCDTIREAWELQTQFREEFRNFNLEFNFKGLALPKELIVPIAQWTNNIDDCNLRWSDNYLKPQSPQASEKMPIVVNWTNVKFTRVQARKLHAYFAANNIDFSRAILTVSKPYPEIYRDNPVYDWEVIKKTGVVKRKSVAREAKTWEGLGGANQSGGFQWIVPDANKEIWYASRSQLDGRSTYNNVVSKDSQFFWVIDSQKERFLKLYPKAKYLGSWFETFVSDYLNNLTAEDFEFFEFEHISTRNDYMMDWTKIHDPVLAKICKYNRSRTDEPVVKRYNAAHQAWQQLKFTDRDKYKFPSFKQDKGQYKALLDQYPLFTDCSFYSYSSTGKTVIEHLHKYINQIYKENNGAI